MILGAVSAIVSGKTWIVKMNKDVLIAMRFNPTSHNIIYTDHVGICSDVLMDICPCNKHHAISIVGAAMGVSDKFVKEHFRRFEACGVIAIKKDIVYWLLSGAKNDNSIPNISYKSDDVKEPIKHIDIVNDDNLNMAEELKPCKLRNDELMTCGFNSKNTPIRLNQCNKCLVIQK